MSLDQEQKQKFLDHSIENKNQNMTETIDYNKEYTPSMWTKRFDDPRHVVPYHVEYVKTRSEIVINNVPHKTEIEYGSSDGQKLDIFGTDLPNSAPILAFVHGGYWMELSREASRYPALPLHRSQVKTVVIGYDLCPKVTLVEIVTQIRQAAKYLFEYAEKMGSKGVYLAGHSAGAHLVAKLLADMSLFEDTPGIDRLQGVFLVSGIYDLCDLLHTDMNDTLQLSRESARLLSPMFDDFSHFENMDVRFYILAAEHDSPVFKRQSREFHQIAQAVCPHHNPYLEIKDNLDHFNIMECLAENDNFLKNLLLYDFVKYAS